MRRLLLIVFAYIAFAHCLIAQCDQEVYVCLYNGEKAKTPLAGVEVIVQNSGSTVTDKNGRCTLHFRSLKPGDKVTLRRVDKPGYVLFNTEAVSQWHIARDGNAFVIVMAKQKDIIKQREMYTRAVTKDLNRQLQLEEDVIGKQLSNGEITNPDYEKKIANLRADYESRLEDIDNYIEHIVHADLSDMDATEKKVLDMVKKGDVLGAIKAYEEMDIVSMYDKRKQEISALEEDIEKVSQAKEKAQDARRQLYDQAKRQNALLWMAGGSENIEHGFQLLRDVAMADTLEARPLLEYGQYCLKSRRLGEAKEALGYVIRNCNDTAMSIMAQIYDCNVEFARQNILQIIDPLISIDNFCKEQAEKHSDQFYLSDERGEALMLLVKSFTSLRDTVKSFQFMKPLMSVTRMLYDARGDNESKRQLVDALHAAHRVYHTYGRRKQDVIDARTIIDEAIGLQEGLYHDDPVRQGAMLAFLHSAKATHLRNKDLNAPFDDVSKEYETAERLYLEAYRKNPKAYANYLVTQNLNHASFYITKEPNMERLAKGKPLLDEAMKYIEITKLYEAEPSQNNIAFAYNMYFRYYWKMEQYDKALEYCEKALEVFRALFKKSPVPNLPSYVQLLNTKKALLEDKKDMFEKEYMDTIEELNKIDEWRKEYNSRLRAKK